MQVLLEAELVFRKFWHLCSVQYLIYLALYKDLRNVKTDNNTYHKKALYQEIQLHN